MAGTAITICNEQEKLLVKKIVRKHKQEVKKYTIKQAFKDLVKQTIQESERIIKGIWDLERKEEEALWAMLDLAKASNMIWYNDDIINRPKKEWF